LEEYPSAVTFLFYSGWWPDKMDEVDEEFHSELDNILPASDEEEELTGCAAKPCCNPNYSLHRFMALIFMCLLGFGK
jgi:hypothetical protein